MAGGSGGSAVSEAGAAEDPSPSVHVAQRREVRSEVWAGGMWNGVSVPHEVRMPRSFWQRVDARHTARPGWREAAGCLCCQFHAPFVTVLGPVCKGGQS